MAKRYPGAEEFMPAGATLLQLTQAVHDCKGCDLYRAATQAVFGEGPARARIVMVGEQPGDREDLAGRPFVGPAGGLLDRALQDAGIERADVYVTNAVKHFKFEERGKRRLHKRPVDSEIDACKPWLWGELTNIRPQLIVCLGAVAARSVIGKHHGLLKERGKFFDHPLGGIVTATVHPSAILRALDSESRNAEYTAFVEDLKRVREKMKTLGRIGRIAS